MTTTANQGSQTLRRLILSCRATQDGFQGAARSTSDTNLKRLFGIYAQQRERFALELSELAAELLGGEGRSGKAEGKKPADAFSHCLETERSTLAVYRDALTEANLSRHARFLVSSQLSLLERVHSRIEALPVFAARA